MKMYEGFNPWTDVKKSAPKVDICLNHRTRRESLCRDWICWINPVELQACRDVNAFLTQINKL